MKKQIIKIIAVITLAAGTAGCGNDFLETDYWAGVDAEDALSSVEYVGTALNGTYYLLLHYYTAGNYATNIGDIPTDIAYWNGGTGHWSGLYQYSIADTDTYLAAIWTYAYKIVDNATRLLLAAQELYNDASDADKGLLDQRMAEAYALRAYAQLVLVNVFGHQVKVNGTDFSSSPGIVVVTEPIPILTPVERSNVGQSYDAILSDFNNSLTRFTAAGGDRGNLFYFTTAAVHGLLARTHLYLENWDQAIQSAQTALNLSGINSLTYEPEAYKALYNNNNTNVESMMALAITSSKNWSASSSGTLWSTYSFSPSPKLLSLYGENDCRRSIIIWDPASTETTPKYAAGKFAHFASGDPAQGTNYLVNAPEMFLIIAEANLKSPNGTLANAQNALLTVARRNSDFETVADLPAAEDELMQFIKDERARELFQEGHRLWDLRRWDELASVYAYGAPNIVYAYNNYRISNLLYPIPSGEITSGWGVEQNDWVGTIPE